jgi:hypothetical protein
LLDNCATDHMFNGRSYFYNYRPYNDHCFFTDTDVSVPVVGKGSLQITNDAGRRIELKDALHVPSFTSNLISVSKADSAGGFFSGGEGKMQVTDASGNILVTGALRKGL